MDFSYFLLVLSVVLCSVAAQGPYTAEKVPDIKTEADKCGVQKEKYICNPNNLLTELDVKSVNISINGIIADTYCQCSRDCDKDRDGFVFAVLVINSVDTSAVTSDGEKTLNETEKVTVALNKLAKDVRAKWKLGECDDDAVLVVATEQKQAGVSVGGKVGNIVSERCFSAINKNFSHLLEEGKFSQAIQNILSNYRRSLKLAQCTVDMYPHKDVNDNPPHNLYKHQEMIVIIIGVVLCVIFFASCGVAIYCTNKKLNKRGYRGARTHE